jgi:hypothetical protein
MSGTRVGVDVGVLVGMRVGVGIGVRVDVGKRIAVCVWAANAVCTMTVPTISGTCVEAGVAINGETQASRYMAVTNQILILRIRCPFIEVLFLPSTARIL